MLMEGLTFHFALTHPTPPPRNQAGKSNRGCLDIICSWSSLPAKDPLITARNTIFFRTVELAYNQGTVLNLLEISYKGVLLNFHQILNAWTLGN